MQQFGTVLRRSVVVGIFLLPAILSANLSGEASAKTEVPTLPEVGTTEEASGAMAGLPAIALATAGSAGADEQAEALILAQYEAALAGRARLDFHSIFIEGDSLNGFWPSTLGLERVFKVGGEWSQGLPAWFIPRDETGTLCLVLGRTANVSLGLTIEFYDGPPESSALDVYLVDQNEQVLATSELYGNMLEGSEMIVQRSLIVPLQGEYSKVRGVYLRGHGELFVLGVSLASDWAEGTSGWPEAADSGTPEAGRTGSDEPLSGRARPPAEPIATSPAGGRSVTHRAGAGAAPLPSKLVKAVTLAQFLMSAEHFIITRAALSGGGGRQTSESLILEDTFGQSSPIGFSYGSGVTLHWGFQQAEVERLAAQVRLEPEVLKVNPGILTAFVELPEGYPVSGITSATCDGASPERMMLNDDGTEMIIKFRRRDIEAALAEQGETLDTHFVVEGTWQGPEGSITFMGEDDIARIVN